MALLTGSGNMGLSTPSASLGFPYFSGPNGNYMNPNLQYNHRRQGDDFEQYYHTTGGGGGGGNKKQHKLKEKINYIKHLIKDKIREKVHEKGGHEHEEKDYGTAISALTLLSFLFFLYILQSCIKDHMNKMAADVTTTTTAATYIQYREQRRRSSSSKLEDHPGTVEAKSSTISADDRVGGTPDFEIYDDEYEDGDITTTARPTKATTRKTTVRPTSPSPPTTYTTMTAYEIYRKKLTQRYDDEDTHFSYMEPVRLIVKP